MRAENSGLGEVLNNTFEQIYGGSILEIEGDKASKGGLIRLSSNLFSDVYGIEEGAGMSLLNTNSIIKLNRFERVMAIYSRGAAVFIGGEPGFYTSIVNNTFKNCYA